MEETDVVNLASGVVALGLGFALVLGFGLGLGVAPTAVERAGSDGNKDSVCSAVAVLSVTVVSSRVRRARRTYTSGFAKSSNWQLPKTALQLLLGQESLESEESFRQVWHQALPNHSC